MKYSAIIPHWYGVKGTMLLIDEAYNAIGHVEKVGNQIHREYIRQAKKKPQEVKR